MEGIIEPVVSEVVNLVLSQIWSTKAKVKSVLLVGGFGRSPYLRERIQKAVNSNVEVIQPPYGWSAVVQGALIQGLTRYNSSLATVRLSSRVARKHIGTDCHVPFKKALHLRSERYIFKFILTQVALSTNSARYFDDFSGSYHATTMKWFIKKVRK